MVHAGPITVFMPLPLPAMDFQADCSGSADAGAYSNPGRVYWSKPLNDWRFEELLDLGTRGRMLLPGLPSSCNTTFNLSLTEA